jgi:hypothetical protein
MRVYRRADFMQLPPGTLFCKIGEAWIFEGSLAVKGETLAGDPGDFYDRDLCTIDFGDSNELFERLEAMRDSGASFPLNTAESRDGLYDREALFLVYEKADLEELQRVIQEAIALAS